MKEQFGKPLNLKGLEDGNLEKHSLQKIVASENTMEHVTFEQRSNNGKEWGVINGKKNKESGHIQNIQKIGAPLGGRANTKKQKDARKKQYREHFQKSGILAAAEAATIATNKKRITVCSNLELEKWYSIKEIELIVKELCITRFSVRSMCIDTNIFESKKIGITFFYKLKPLKNI